MSDRTYWTLLRASKLLKGQALQHLVAQIVIAFDILQGLALQVGKLVLAVDGKWVVSPSQEKRGGGDPRPRSG